MARVFVLDAMGLAYRAYYAFIRRPLVNSRGENTSAIFGFANSALKIRREEQPDYWALAWDGPGPTFRHERYPDYKATRKPIPEDLLAQIPALEDVAQALGLPILEVQGVEADDVMATLARRGEREGHEVVLVTSDKDLLQLVTDRVRLLSPSGRGEDYAWVGREEVHAKWGVAPEQIRDVLALMGDSSDNVPGVPGVGQKTACELIRTFGTLDALYERLSEVKRPALRRKLETNRERALLSKDLVTVRIDVDVPSGWEELRVAPIRQARLRELARRWEIVRFERLAREEGVAEAEAGAPVRGREAAARGTTAEMPGTGVRLRGEPPPPEEAAPADEPQAPAGDVKRGGGEERPPEGTSRATGQRRLSVGRVTAPPVPTPRQGALDLWPVPETGADGAEVPGAPLDLEDAIHAVRARAIHGLAVLPVIDGDDARCATLIGLGLAARDGSACYVPLRHDEGRNVLPGQAREWLAPVLADEQVPKVAQDLKRAAHALAREGMPLGGLDFDVHVASFLCDPGRNHSLDALAADVLGMRLPTLLAAQVRGGRRPGPAALSGEDAAPIVAARTAALTPLAESLRPQLEAREQWKLYTRIEHPLIPVLFDMERAGVLLDGDVLREMSARAAEDIGRLEADLHALAGEPINLNSGPQIARVLFEKLELKAGRRTKTGYSTDQSVLESLASDHPFPAKLLEYRLISKLKSTYLDALPAAVDPGDGRIHTTFHQAGAATGRLSSSSPNLQNIPMRTPQGRAIRRAFIAPPGMVLIGADYSQIELRVMAHLSEDPNLVAAFESGEDVHAGTARRIFGARDGDLDPALRGRAKTVNFGVMYGMGARSLSQQMGISLEEARDFISHYFRVFARVREYLDRTVEEARRSGYVQTLLGRRRYLGDLSSLQGARRALAERVAINTPIQGTAADLMKLAMIRVHRALKRHGGSARLLLQVHDELLIESPKADAEAVAGLVRQEMEECFPLRVPLVVSLGQGPTWYDVHA